MISCIKKTACMLYVCAIYLLLFGELGELDIRYRRLSEAYQSLLFV